MLRDGSVFATVTPSHADVLEVRASRVAVVGDFLDALTPWAPDPETFLPTCT